ncbi:uncharacterized protein LOC100215245 isoform X2 [Hydra vulgaris]|uniref:ATP-dependent RNA helicase n=1 Tax=Hydra vulgaris TaxID=6087 RepID=A0ABM4CTI2_HYDVU
MTPIGLKHARNMLLINRMLYICIRQNHSFHELKITVSIIRKLREFGIKSPTNIQIQTIQEFQSGKNIVINSETGSGKTLAYALPIAQKLINLKKVCKKLPRPFALVLVPNAHLAHQVCEVFQSLLSLNTCFACEESRLYLLNTDIVVSTALYLSTYPLNVLNETQVVVIDEADIQIASKVGKTGKKDPLFNLIKHFNQADSYKPPIISLDTPNSFLEFNNFKRQFVFVGATMPDNLSPKSKTAIPYIRSWLPDIQIVHSESAHKVVPTAEMEFIDVLEGNKYKHLVECVSLHCKNKDMPYKILVFVNKVETAINLYKKLTSKINYESILENDAKFTTLFALFHEVWQNNISLLHSNIDNKSREEVFSQILFANRAMIITTDVISRGIDFPDLDMVVQYDFATNAIDILHRAGRTARMGKKGKIVNFITSQDKELSTAVQDLLAKNLPFDSLFSRHRSLSRKKHRNQDIAKNDVLESENRV